jgi:hypothetical protein
MMSRGPSAAPTPKDPVSGSVPTLARRPLRAALLAVAAAVGLGGVVAAPARAGDYLAYVCHAPDESAFSLDSAWAGQSNVAFSGPIDVCGRGANGYYGLNLASAGAPPTYPSGAATSLTWTAPAHVQVISLSARRSVFAAVSQGDDVNAVPSYSLIAYGPQSATALETCHPTTSSSCLLGGSPFADSTQNAVTFGPLGATSIVMKLECAGASGGTCANGSGGGARMYTAFGRATLTLRDEAPPTAGSIGGSALDAGPRSGTVAVTFNAFDDGAGVYQDIVSVDGTEVGRATPSDPTGTCADAVPGNATELEFRASKPCPGSATVSAPLDTTKLANGTHQLKVVLRDASGNVKTVVDRAITVDNSAVAPGGGGGGGGAGGVPAGPAVPNGSGGNLATGALVVDRKHRTLSTAFGHKLTIKRTLRDAAKVPIAGAQVDVYEQVDRVGAPWSKVATVTSDAKGAVRYVPSTGASRTVRFAYATVVGSTTYASTLEVKVAVAAKVSIAVAKRSVPRRGTINFSGTVGLDGLPPHTRVEVQYLSHGDWRAIDTASVNAKGRWSYVRHLTTPFHGTIAFRALLRPAADLGSAKSASKTIRVRVR